MLTDQDKTLIRNERRFPRERRLARTGIPEMFWEASWESFIEREATVDMRATVMDYGDRVIAEKPLLAAGRGLLLQGPPGVGKTMAACILGVQLSDAGFYVRFTSLPEYLERLGRQITLQQAWNKFEDWTAYEEWQQEEERLRTMREIAHLVILDDVGKEHHTPSRYSVDMLYVLLRRRVNLGRPVVMTSNRGLQAWAEKYDGAMQSFVEQACEIVPVLEEDDMRLKLFRR